jgi:hypothetical protein
VTTANIDGLPVRSEDADLFAANPGEFCRHANEVIFRFSIVGGQGISVHDDHRRVMCMAHSGELGQYLFDDCYSYGSSSSSFAAPLTLFRI